MGADNQAEKVMDRIARLEAAEAEIERTTNALISCERQCQDLKNEIERLRSALQKIASCDKRVDGDIVDIARKALGGD